MALAPGTQDRVRQAFAELCSATNEQEFLDRLFRHPVLLRGDVVQWLVGQIDRSTEQAKLSRLAMANEIRMSILASDYPADLGPVEQIWRRVDSGELSIEQAHVAARQLPVTESLMGLYVTHLFFSLAEGDMHVLWRRSRMRGDILLSALDACAHRDEHALRRGRLLGTARWAHFLLIEVPEVRILELGDAAGRAALTDAQAAKEAEEVRHMSYELAALWGDPYVSDRSTASYERDMMAWRRRGAEELGQVEGLGPEAWAMPESEVALRTSIGYWRTARAAAPNDPAVLIGLAEAAAVLQTLTGGELEDDVVSAVREGVAITAEPDSDAVLRHRFLTMSNQLSRQ